MRLICNLSWKGGLIAEGGINREGVIRELGLMDFLR